jgi:ParB-like chromosome segregation protein Spo0J
MMKEIPVPIDRIYIPAGRRGSADPATVKELAENILENGQQVPISVREDRKKGFVLVTGLHRLEACKALGEKTISAIVVSAPQR